MARVSLEDLNTMELELLFAIDFQLTVSFDDYTAHTQALLSFAARYHPHDPPRAHPLPPLRVDTLLGDSAPQRRTSRRTPGATAVFESPPVGPARAS